MATYNFMNEQVTTDASGTPTTVAPITSSTTNTSGALSNVQTGEAKPISMAQMYPAQPITVPTAPATPNPAEATVASASETTKTLDQYIKEMTPQKTETSQQYDSILGELNNLLPGLTGRGSDQLAAETQAGLPDLKQKLAGLNAQILSKVAELTKSNASYEQLIANLENPANAQQQGIPMSAIIGQQAQARKAQLAEANSKSADLGLLQAVASGMQGNIQAMQQGIDRAIDLKYQDRESTVNLKMQQLQLLEGKLNKEEAIQKAALERKYNEEREKLAEEKAKAKENITLAFQGNVTSQFANKGGEFFRVSDGKSYSSPEEFFKDAGIKSFNEAYQKGLVTDISAQRLADIDFVQQLRLKYADAGINFNDDAETAVSKLANSNSYFKDNYMAPQDTSIKPISINGQDYFQDPATGELLPAWAFVDGGTPGSTKPLSAEASKLLANTDSGLANISAMAKLLQEKGTVSIFTPNAFNQTRKAYFTQADNLVDVLGRMRSGGAITTDEEARFKNLLPKITDKASVWQDKLTQLRTLLEGVKTSLAGTTFNSAGNASASTSGNQVKGMSQRAQALPLLNVNVGDKAVKLSLDEAYPQGSRGGQCGTWVRSIVEKTGKTYPRVGDSLREKAMTVKKYGTRNGSVGSVVITSENKNNGHVAYVIGKTNQGWVLAESNYGLNQKVSYNRVIPFNSPSIIGFIKPT